MEAIHEAPDVTSFRSYSDYQSHTPESFSTGPPILLHRSPNATLRILPSDLIHAPLLAPLVTPSANGQESVPAHEPKEIEDEGEVKQLEVPRVDVWVASDYLYLHFPSASQRGGVRIPYPLITLHAIQSSSPPSIYLQLQSSAVPDDDHDPESTLELTLIPALAPQPAGDPSSPSGESGLSPTQALYAALRDGADLWPDLGDEDDGERPAMMFDVDGNDGAGDGLLPPPMPGSGGWITADNVGDFLDEEGNWIGREAGTRPDGVSELGEGAGIVRPRDDDDHDGETRGINGEETKWRRTD